MPVTPEPHHQQTRPRRLPTRRLAAVAAAGAAAALTASAVFTAGSGREASAQVTALNPLDPALDFNVFVEGDTSLASTEMEGPMATGGDLIAQGYYNIAIHDTGTFIDGGDSVPSELVVGGQVDLAGSLPSSVIRLLNSGYAKIGDLSGVDVLDTDQNGASVNTQIVASGAGYNSTPRIELTTQQPAGSVGPASPIDFASAFTTLRSNAASLATCRRTVTMTDSSGNRVRPGQVQSGQQIHISLRSGQTNVLDLTGDDLNNMAELDFDSQPSSDAPLLVNVDTSAQGGDFDWNVANQAGIGGSAAPYILWNFDDATALTITGGDSLEGSILAPNATYEDESPSNVEGQIVTESASLGSASANGGEVHYFPFDAELTCERDINPAPPDTTDASTSDSPTTDGPTDGSSTTEPATDGTSSHGSHHGSHYGSHQSSGPTLAVTGAALGWPLVAALAMIGGGAAVLAAVRRRARSAE